MLSKIKYFIKIQYITALYAEEPEEDCLEAF
jgi:hypothetical protein